MNFERQKKKKKELKRLCCAKFVINNDNISTNIFTVNYLNINQTNRTTKLKLRL